MKITQYVLVLLFIIGGKAISQENNLLYQKDGFKIYKSSAIFKGTEIYNAKKDLEKLKEIEDSDERPHDYSFNYSPLSLVGNYYSYEASEGGILGCGVPGSIVAIKTINLNTNKDVYLTDVFTKKSILKALKQDKWIKQIQSETNTDFSKLNSITALIKAINELNYAKFKRSGFTVLKYDSKKEEVLIRFVGQQYMGFNHHKHLQLGLRLKPKQEFKHLLKTKTRFVLGDFKNGLTK